MAVTKVPIESLDLFNNWGGPHRANWKPDDLLVPSATALWPLTTVISLYNHISGTGWSAFVYVKLASVDVTYPCLADHICVANGTVPLHGSVTNDLTTGTLGYNGGEMVIAPCAVADGYYFWGWCGGCLPVDYCPLLVATDITTHGNIAIGSLMILANAGEAGATYGEIGLAPQSETTFKMAVGYSHAVDA